MLSALAIGSTDTILTAMFGAPQQDTHVKLWRHHAFRLSPEGRSMMRARLQAMFPGLDRDLAHRVYATRNRDYHFDERYI